jgi:hypothetical protein
MSYCHTCTGGMSNMQMNFGPRVISRMAAYLGGLTCGTYLDSPTLTAIAASPGAAVCAGRARHAHRRGPGTELRFQWFRNGSRVTGATASFTVATPVNNDRWDVVVYSACGVIDTRGTSAGVILTTPPPGSRSTVRRQPHLGRRRQRQRHHRFGRVRNR